jgi:hypothetical protein
MLVILGPPAWSASVAALAARAGVARPPAKSKAAAFFVHIFIFDSPEDAPANQWEQLGRRLTVPLTVINSLSCWRLANAHRPIR